MKIWFVSFVVFVFVVCFGVEEFVCLIEVEDVVVFGFYSVEVLVMMMVCFYEMDCVF